MKIGFDVSDLCTDRADGTTRFTRELAQRLPVLAAKHEWHYYAPCTSPQPSPYKEEGVSWHASPWPRYWTQTRLPADLYRYSVDVLFIPIQQLPYVRPGRMKTVVVMHDLAVHKYPEQFTYRDWLLLHWFSAYAAREADSVIAVSQATADDIKKYYGREEGVEVVHHGVDHDKFRLPSGLEREDSWQQLKAKYPELKKPYVLYVGQIQPRKNLTGLIRAMEKFSEKQLVIAGGHGWMQEPILKEAKRSPAAERISFLGRVPDELLPALYWQAEMFVWPSLYEGFGMPILEAMACGCPVVTSNVSSMPEVARQSGGQAGYAAVLVDPLKEESIVNGIRQAGKRREELREKGLRRAKEFSWEKTAEQIMAVLES